MVNLIRRVGVCSPFCSQRNVVCRSPRATAILCFSAVPACKGITCTGRCRQGIRRIVGYGLGAFAHRTAISVKRYGVVVCLPVCGVSSVSVATRRDNHGHSSLVKSCSGPANKGVACTGRLNEGDIATFNVVSRRIRRAVRSVIHRITDAIGDRNGSCRYYVTVRVLTPSRQAVTRVAGDSRATKVPYGIVACFARKSKVTILVYSLRADEFTVYVEFKDGLICRKDNKLVFLAEEVASSIGCCDSVNDSFVNGKRSADDRGVKEKLVAEAVLYAEERVRTIAVLNVIVITSVTHSRRIVNLYAGNERTLGGITHAVCCHKVKVDRVTACYGITACCFNRNRAIFSKAVRCVCIEFSAVRGFLDVTCRCSVIGKVDVTRRVNIYVRSNYIISVTQMVGCGNTEGYNITTCQSTGFKRYANGKTCSEAIFCSCTEETCIYGVGYVDLRFLVIELNFGSSVNLDTAYRSRLYVTEMVGCRNEELKCRACLLNTFGKFKSNIVKNVAEAILCNYAKCGESNAIRILERSLGSCADGRCTVNFNTIGNIISIALAVGCAALYSNGVATCKGAAILGCRYGERNTEAVYCGCSEVIACDAIGSLHVNYGCITSDNGCAVNLNVLNLNNGFIVCCIGCLKNDGYEITCGIITFLNAYGNGKAFAVGIACGCTEERCAYCIGHLDEVFILVILDNGRTVNVDSADRLGIVNAVETGCNETNDDRVTDFVSAADKRCCYGYRVAVSINCGCSEGVCVNTFDNADFCSFCQSERYLVVNPLCIQSNIFCRHRCEVVLRGQSAVKPTYEGLFRPCRISRSCNGRSEVLRNSSYGASTVRNERNGIFVSNPLRIEHGIVCLIPNANAITGSIGVLSASTAYAVIPTAEGMSYLSNINRNSEVRAKGQNLGVNCCCSCRSEYSLTACGGVTCTGNIERTVACHIVIDTISYRSDTNNISGICRK